MSIIGKQSWSVRMVAPLEPGIVCNEISRMLPFYADVLGLEVVADAEATAEMSARFGASPHGFRIVRLQTSYGERIKLVESRFPPQENSVPEWVFERHGLAYLTFIVADIDEVAAHLNAHNVRFVSDEPVEVRKGFRALFVIDPEGNYIEFVQYSDLASYRPDLPRQAKDVGSRTK